MAKCMDGSQRASTEFLMLPNLIKHFDWAKDFLVTLEHLRQLLQDGCATLVRLKLAPLPPRQAIDKARQGIMVFFIHAGVPCQCERS